MHCRLPKARVYEAAVASLRRQQLLHARAMQLDGKNVSNHLRGG
jgi:hypothetical protein